MTEWHTVTPLYAHQREAVDKLSGLRVGGLFMDMGTGKTRTAFELICLRRRKISKAVWVCPVSLMETARRELCKHTDCRAEDIHVFSAKTDERHIPPASWYIVGLESIGSSARVVCTLDKLVDERTYMVVDESTYIKGQRAKRTRRLQILGARTAYRLILTGTPMTQGLEDIYSQMTFLSPKILGYSSWYTFAARHLKFDPERPGRIVDRTGEDWVARKIAPYVYQVRKEECLDLPPKSHSTRWCDLTEEQQEMYEAVKMRFYEELSERDPADAGIAIYRLFSGLQSVAAGLRPRGFPGPRRLHHRRVQTLMQALAAVPPEPVVIWARYLESVEEIADAACAEGRAVHVMSGRVAPAKRSVALDAWRASGGVLVATLGVGGHGLDMTAASWALFYSNDWKYSSRIQAEDRCHRMGQTENVHYTDIWADCGIDLRIQHALERKGDALEYFKRQVDALKGDKDGLRELMHTL